MKLKLPISQCLGGEQAAQPQLASKQPAQKQPAQKQPAPKRPALQASGTVVVTIGTSRSNTKSASVPAGYTCPSRVDKTNWLTLGDTAVANTRMWFQVSQSGTTLKVTRKDRNKSWPFELKIQCSAGAHQRVVSFFFQV